jgi:hypothetical protein
MWSLLGSQIVVSFNSSLQITGRTLSFPPSDVAAVASPLTYKEEEAVGDVRGDWPSKRVVR